jgi:hypothetical protein
VIAGDALMQSYPFAMLPPSHAKSSDVWNTLHDHWIMYQKKHYARDDNQVKDLVNLKKNVRQVTMMTGKKTCQMEMRLMILRKQV